MNHSALMLRACDVLQINGTEPGDFIFRDESREIMRWRGATAELQFDDRDAALIVQTFWRSMGRYASSPKLGFHLGANGKPPSVWLHKCGDVTGENYKPDERALKMWSRIAAAWPKEVS